MKRFDWVAAWRGARTGVCLLAVAAACAAALPQQALAAQVQTYVIFEVAASSDQNAVAEKLRSTSLGNCLQLVVGQHARDVFVHIACDESGQDSKYLEQAFLQLSGVDGIARATIVALKQGTN
ncbi:MAG: hypothetical protein ACXWJ8_04185 [Xanthobacteraceae bacterium]